MSFFNKNRFYIKFYQNLNKKIYDFFFGTLFFSITFLFLLIFISNFTKILVKIFFIKFYFKFYQNLNKKFLDTKIINYR